MVTSGVAHPQQQVYRKPPCHWCIRDILVYWLVCDQWRSLVVTLPAFQEMVLTPQAWMWFRVRYGWTGETCVNGKNHLRQCRLEDPYLHNFKTKYPKYLALRRTSQSDIGCVLHSFGQGRNVGWKKDRSNEGVFPDYRLIQESRPPPGQMNGVWKWTIANSHWSTKLCHKFSCQSGLQVPFTPVQFW